MKIDITVDGARYEDDVESRTLLVNHLREQLGLTGVNIGCDTSSCGACTIQLDGASVKSCTVLAAQADGGEVTTIHGISESETDESGWHPLQKAFHQEHGLQCGYCTPGMIMAAKGLLESNPSPTEAEIREGIEGNLCRCTGYVNIVRAIQRAAAELRGEPMPETAEVSA